MKIQWGERVTKIARTVLQKRKTMEKKKLPSPEDIKKVTTYTTKTLKEPQLVKENYWDKLQLVQTRLLLFNKIRSGELEVVSNKTFSAIKNSRLCASNHCVYDSGTISHNILIFVSNYANRWELSISLSLIGNIWSSRRN